MSLLPPPIREQEFKALNTIRLGAIATRFGNLVEQLHAFLNQLPCVRDIQQARLQWVTKTRSNKAFGSFGVEPRHWYTFNHGGRNEAQFNIGLYLMHLRVGLGFEFTKNRRGNPPAVRLAYDCFIRTIKDNVKDFERFVYYNSIEVEWGSKSIGLKFIPTSKVLDWILLSHPEAEWIFIGRLLKREFDAVILENPAELGKTIESIFTGFRPLWEKTQIMTKRLEV